jgi:23S rRNA pseudouridine1911/1915/1917 synthase
VSARLELIVPAEAAGMRLDRFLARAPELPTRSQAKLLVAAGRVTVAGIVRKPSFTVEVGTTVVVDVPVPVASAIEPEALPLQVLVEDPVFLAIDKAPGMAAHPAPGSLRGTVVNAVLHRLGPLDGVGDPTRPGIVHRLDKDTSGVMLIARTASALAALGRQFHDRTVRKTYIALVHGQVRGEQGRIDLPIGRHPTERKRMSVQARHSRAAATAWAVTERFAGATLVTARPETGRTHQIRVHLAAMGYPIVGDALYGGRRSRAVGPLATFPRQALHAAALQFQHPESGEPVVIAAPLPADMEHVLAALRSMRDS